MLGSYANPVDEAPGYGKETRKSRYLTLRYRPSLVVPKVDVKLLVQSALSSGNLHSNQPYPLSDEEQSTAEMRVYTS